MKRLPIILLALVVSSWAVVSQVQDIRRAAGGGSSLPADAAGFLENDGAGNLSWDTPPGGGDVTKANTLTNNAPLLGGGAGNIYATNAVGFRAAVGLVIGTDVQAFSSNLADWSALATSAKQDADADLADLADGSLTGSKVGTGINGDNVTTGTVVDARIDAAIARDSEVASTYAPLASPALTGNPTVPTASPGDNDTSAASTAFVTAAVAAGGGGGSAPVGTMVNSGASVVGQVPAYTSTTGTNLAPSLLSVVSTNATLPGVASVHGVVATNSISIPGYSVTGSDANSALAITGTWNTSGNPSALKIVTTDTTSGSTAKAIEVLGGVAGATALFSVSKAGAVTMANSLTLNNNINVGNGWWLIDGSSGASGGIDFGSGHTIKWGSATTHGAGTDDLFVGRDAAATLQQGQDSATAVDQTYKGPDGSGTDKVGGGVFIGGGKSTGTAAGGEVVIQTANSSTTGSSANTYSERFHAIPKFVNLTESTATTILTVPVAAANYIGFTATVTVFASDGTDHQSKTSVVTVDAVAKTTTISHGLTQVDNTTAASAGTLSCTYDLNDAGSNVLQLRANAASSLTQTQLRAKIVVTAINSNGSAVIGEQ